MSRPPKPHRPTEVTCIPYKTYRFPVPQSNSRCHFLGQARHPLTIHLRHTTDVLAPSTPPSPRSEAERVFSLAPPSFIFLTSSRFVSRLSRLSLDPGSSPWSWILSMYNQARPTLTTRATGCRQPLRPRRFFAIRGRQARASKYETPPLQVFFHEAWMHTPIPRLFLPLLGPMELTLCLFFAWFSCCFEHSPSSALANWPPGRENDGRATFTCIMNPGLVPKSLSLPLFPKSLPLPSPFPEFEYIARDERGHEQVSKVFEEFLS